MKMFLLTFALASSLFAQNPGPALTGAISTSSSGTTNHARQFNGTSDYLNSASAIGSPLGVQFATTFWLYTASGFSTNDDILMETSTDYDLVNGFIIDPNSSAHSAFIWEYHGGGGYFGCSFAWPSSGWHQYVLNMVMGSFCGAYVDGVAQTTTNFINTNTVTSVANNTFYFMSRAGTTLFLTGRLSEPAFYSGVISSADATALAACGRPTSVTSATLEYYWPINQTSPEVATTGGVNLTVNGTTNVASHCSF
jgi:hypothetical protein